MGDRKDEPQDKPLATNRAFSALLKILNLGQKEAAAELGMGAGSVSNYVSGKRPLLLDNYRRKCASLGLEAAGEQALALVAEVDRARHPGGAVSTASAGQIAEVGRLAEQLAASIPAKVWEAVAEQDRQRLQALWKNLGEKLTLAEWRL